MALPKPDCRNIIINDDDNNQCAEDGEVEQEELDSNSISTHLYIKPSHSKQTLEKQVVLRRIRHRQRMNNFRSALQAFIGSSSSSSTTKNNQNKGSGPEIKWVDDAFAAL